MDRMLDSGSDDPSSNLGGVTIKRKKHTSYDVCFCII